MEVRDLLSKYDYDGDNAPIIRGSALGALNGEPKWEEKVMELMDAVDSYIPLPQRENEKPFLMPIEDVFSITGRGTVVTGRIETGIIHVGDPVEIIGLEEKTLTSTCTGVEMFRKLLDEGEAGDNVVTRHKKELMECARMLKLGNLTEHLEELLHQAQEKQLTYPEFLLACLREEVRTRENRKYLCRLKAAGLPARHDLDRYDFTRTEGIDSRKLRELRELVWVGQAYNLLLAGGSGTGKTYIAAGLVHEAVKAGYRAYMVTLEDLLTCLKTRDVSRHAMKTYKRIMKAQLLAIDNATLFPLKREDIMLLFKLVNEFQEKTSLIVTANYSLTEWLAIPGEEAVAAALLDRLLYCCEIIQLSRNSYRMENRKTIFSNRSEDTDTLKELTTVK